MPVTLEDLAPYRSLLLCKCAVNWTMADGIEELRQHAESLENVDLTSAASTPATKHGVRECHFYYRRAGQPGWLLNNTLEDKLHELVVLLKKGDYVAILATESRFRDQIRHKFSDPNMGVLGRLSPIPATVLNAAFVKGKTNTLWLAGTHRRVASTVDNKAISGTDLLYALDPLGDQSFYFTAARDARRKDDPPHA